MFDKEPRKLARGGEPPRLHRLDVPFHLLANLGNELIQFLGVSLGHQVHTAVWQVPHIPSDLVPACDPLCRIAETNPLHHSREVNLTLLHVDPPGSTVLPNCGKKRYHIESLST